LRRTAQMKAEKLLIKAVMAISNDGSSTSINTTPPTHVHYLFPIFNRKIPTTDSI
jgi:hypothetical protein